MIKHVTSQLVQSEPLTKTDGKQYKVIKNLNGLQQMQCRWVANEFSPELIFLKVILD